MNGTRSRSVNTYEKTVDPQGEDCYTVYLTDSGAGADSSTQLFYSDGNAAYEDESTITRSALLAK